ncbi:MAG TPA: rhodanese-like domain-containing protein [Ilumatobacteraceae bacterium]|nr:rhodanese-like domain-containing protein [Ilumatobacteraceae bacterium]
MTSPVPGPVVRDLLSGGGEIALLDVRSERLHATGHPLFAACFPRQRLEVMALDLLPRRDVPIVVVGASAGDADEAVGALAGLGFSDVAPLAGGLAGWVAGGGELFTDVNAPSKAFGELVESLAATPSVTAEELQGWLAAGVDLALVDARTFDEHRTMTVPGSRSAPGAELVARAASFAPDPATPIVVHCAGRTRSIIGAQSLLDAGVPNRVLALRDGTIGWTLAGLELTLGDTASVDLVTPHSDE